MPVLDPALEAHLGTGLTTLCRAWAITRSDGALFGFTDHDRALTFDGMTFKADTGLSAFALQQSTGLSVDNTEALGALSDVSITEDDIEAGRFDGAEVRAWLVNWADPGMRWLQFRGKIGEIQRSGSAFRAELRGLAESLNRPLGRIYQKPCTAVLGDASCRFNLNTAGYSTELAVQDVTDNRVFDWPDLPGFEPGWFARGRLSVLTGAAKGLWASVKRDAAEDGLRRVELWQGLGAGIAPGDLVHLLAGCDKRMDSCKFKFNNLMNYQGFPDIPGEDWIMSVPKRADANTGGSRR